MNYAFVHDGKVFGPDGPIKDVEGTPLAAKDAEAYNLQSEIAELDYLKSGPPNIYAYVKLPKDGVRQYPEIQTWLGTTIGLAWIGHRAYVGFGHNTYRRPVTVRIFGTLYHGWYMESSGDYCRLRRAKEQGTKYAAGIQG